MFVLKVNGTFLSGIGDTDIATTSMTSEAIGFHSAHQANAAAQTLAKFYGVVCQMFEMIGDVEAHNLERSVRKEILDLRTKTGRNYSREGGRLVEITYVGKRCVVMPVSKYLDNVAMLSLIREMLHRHD